MAVGRCAGTPIAPVCCASRPHWNHCACAGAASATQKSMKIRFIWPESSSEKDYAAAVEKYLQRIGHFFPTEVVEVRGERGRQSQSDASIMRGQSERLLAAMP